MTGVKDLIKKLPKISAKNASQIVKHAKSIGINVSYNDVTIADGNCWYNALLTQLNRKGIAGKLPQEKKYVNCHQLRLDVIRFCRAQSNNSMVSHLIESNGIDHKEW